MMTMMTAADRIYWLSCSLAASLELAAGKKRSDLRSRDAASVRSRLFVWSIVRPFIPLILCIRLFKALLPDNYFSHVIHTPLFNLFPSLRHFLLRHRLNHWLYIHSRFLSFSSPQQADPSRFPRQIHNGSNLLNSSLAGLSE